MKEKEDIGKQIAAARKKKKLTQQELAKLLMVSDKAISNWETGKNYPDLTYIKDISKYLDIDLINLIVDKKQKDYNKIIKIMFYILMIILTLLIAFLLTYFINNYNKFKFYTISLDNKKYVINDSYLMIDNNELIFSLNDIEGDHDYKVTLYYLNGSKKYIIATKNNYKSIKIEENLNNLEYFNKDILNNLDKLYLEIEHYSENGEVIDNINLIVKEKSSNNKLYYINNNKLKTNMVSDRIITLLNNNGYVRSDNNTYVKNKDNLTLAYNVVDKIYSYTLEENEMKYNAVYQIDKDILHYEVEYHSVVVEGFTYQNEKVSCLIGKCNNNKELIESFFNEYNLLK